MDLMILIISARVGTPHTQPRAECRYATLKPPIGASLRSREHGDPNDVIHESLILEVVL